MRRSLRLKSTPITEPLNNARYECRAIELIYLAWHANIRIHERVVVRDYVFVRYIGRDRVLEGTCRAADEEALVGAVDEVEEG
jgi:hypothetical protein